MRIYGVESDTETDMLLRLVRDGREHGWWEELTDGVAPERFVMDAPSRYPAMEAEASSVRSFDIALLHGLLQIPAYTRAVMSTLLSHRGVGEVDRLVELRHRRQQALFDRERPLELSVVMDEGVLRRVVGSPELMAEQLRSIVERSRLPNVTVRILPFAVGFHRAHIGSFAILEFPRGAGTDVVFIEGHAGDTYLESRSDVDLYKDVLSDVTGRALPPEESRALITRYQHEHALPRKAPP